MKSSEVELAETSRARPLSLRRIGASLLALVLCLYFTWSGQEFLAHNVGNDADSSYFAYGGWLIQHGGQLYRDFWDQKPPLIFYQNAALISWFGLNFKAWAWLHGLAFLGALGLVTYSMRQHVGLFWGLGLAVALSYGFNLNNYLDYGNRTEFGVAWFEMLAFAGVMNWMQYRQGWWLFAAGSCGAIAGLYKPVGMASFLAMLALMLGLSVVTWAKHKKNICKNINIKNIKNNINIKTKTKTNININQTSGQEPACNLSVYLWGAFWSCSGFALTLCLCLVPLATQGMLLEVWRATLIVPLSLTGGTGRTLLDAAVDLPLRLGPLWGLAWPWLLWPWVVCKVTARERVLLIWLGLWTMATLCGIILQRHGHPHYYHPAIVPVIAGAFCTLALGLRQCYFGGMAKLAFILVFVFSSLYFARYFVVRQWQQVQQLEAYEAGYKPYLQLAQWLKSEMAQKNPAEKNMEKHVGGFFENVPTFYYWSMGYSLYLHSDLPCPGRISPSILTLGDNGAQLVLDDLQNLQQKNNIVFLVENPETFPKNITQPDSFPAGSRARQTVETYLSWRDREFKKVDIDFGPFQVYRRVSP